MTTEFKYVPHTIEEWHALVDALNTINVGVATLKGGGAACLFIQVETNDGEFIHLGDVNETWTADVYASLADVEHAQSMESFDTRVPSSNHDAVTVAKGFLAAWKAWEEHPQTDEHLAACVPCMMAHDKAQPDNLSVKVDDLPLMTQYACKNDDCGLVFSYRRVCLGKDVPPRLCPECGQETVEPFEYPAGLPPDPEGENDRRASEAEEVLNQFESAFGEAPYGGISPDQLRDLREQNLSDLLCNFGHFCDRNGLDLQEVIRRAANHYNEETGNQGAQFTVSN